MQITSDRDRVPRARCPRRRRVEKMVREESTTTERSSGRRRGGRDEPSGEKREEEKKQDGERGRTYHEREKKRVHVHICVCIRAEGDSPHCDCYTHGRNVPPVCRLMPTRNQTRANSSYCSLSSQQQSNRLHNLPPALLFAARRTCHTHTHAAHGHIYSLYEQSTKGEKEKEERVSLTTGSTVYEKCSTRTAREKRNAIRCDLRKNCQEGRSEMNKDASFKLKDRLYSFSIQFL